VVSTSTGTPSSDDAIYTNKYYRYQQRCNTGTGFVVVSP
jgi:hypothetical protein